MSCMHWLLLTVVKKIQGERKIGGIYHLLTGKLAAQTIQDAYLFHLSPFVATIEERDKKVYERNIQHLVDQQYIVVEQGIPTITTNGENYFQELEKKYHLPLHFDGGKYEWNRARSKLWDRLSLTIQSLSFILANKRSFIPVCYELEAQQWVKQFFWKNNYSYMLISEQLYRELVEFLQQFPERERELFVNRLTGHDVTGKTQEQLCAAYEGDPFFTRLYFQAILHQWIDVANKTPEKYPMLYQFVHDIHESNVITSTAQETWFYVQQGKTLAEIAQLRRLKQSTIEDHFIELAIYEPKFSFETYISDVEIDEILAVVNRLNTKRLRKIKEYLPSHISYFQIRLALTQLYRRNTNS